MGGRSSFKGLLTAANALSQLSKPHSASSFSTGARPFRSSGCRERVRRRVGEPRRGSFSSLACALVHSGQPSACELACERQCRRRPQRGDFGQAKLPTLHQDSVRVMRASLSATLASGPGYLRRNSRYVSD